LARQPAFGAFFIHQPTTSSFHGEKQTFVSLRGERRISKTIFKINTVAEKCQVSKQKEADTASLKFGWFLFTEAGASP